ncbi:hypothetical protein [Sphaerisporangium rhizosphaerae]|uniref:Uncharacterized protein n=1 Tax=Sphaerisporangium rhizosphaerae TaxID=2269375 RepID=A0ABW2PBC7_9ACTN
MASSDIEGWRRSIDAIGSRSEVWAVQLATQWVDSGDWASIRDDLDLALFRVALRQGRAFRFHRLLLYDLPSDQGDSPSGYDRSHEEHDRWLARVRRHLALVGAEGSAGTRLPLGSQYRVRLVILSRVGQPSTIEVQDGLWVDVPPPAEVSAAWSSEGLIPLDPHEEDIIGPHSDRNPLWAGIPT